MAEPPTTVPGGAAPGPFYPSQPQTAACPPPAEGRPTSEQLTLLVVDDDLLHARLLKANLERPGRLRVEVAGSGEQALDRIAAGPVDAVLTDLAMPEIDGLELVRQIRSEDAALPVIIMTAHASIATAVDCIRAGATDFLPKPVHADALIAFVERAVLARA